MVRMEVRDIQPRDGLPQSAGVAQYFSRVGERILRVDHDELRRQLDDVRIDDPTFFGRGVGMDSQAVRLRDRYCA
jgi:hypothetical protein